LASGGRAFYTRETEAEGKEIFERKKKKKNARDAVGEKQKYTEVGPRIGGEHTSPPI
jgi:hypothetical protein